MPPGWRLRGDTGLAGVRAGRTGLLGSRGSTCCEHPQTQRASLVGPGTKPQPPTTLVAAALTQLGEPLGLGRAAPAGAPARAGALAATSLLAAAVLPARTGPWTRFPFQLAVTVLGYLAGEAPRFSATLGPATGNVPETSGT